MILKFHRRSYLYHVYRKFGKKFISVLEIDYGFSDVFPPHPITTDFSCFTFTSNLLWWSLLFMFTQYSGEFTLSLNPIFLVQRTINFICTDFVLPSFVTFTFSRFLCWYVFSFYINRCIYVYTRICTYIYIRICLYISVNVKKITLNVQQTTKYIYTFFPKFYSFWFHSDLLNII